MSKKLIETIRFLKCREYPKVKLNQFKRLIKSKDWSYLKLICLIHKYEYDWIFYSII